MAAYFLSVLESFLDFSNILNISISASWLVLAVLVLRIFLKKAPKWVNVCLWGLVAIRLILPVSIESRFSLIPSSQTIPRDIMISQGERLHQQARLDVITNPIYQMEVTTDIAPTIDRLQTTMTMFTLLWLVGIAVLLIYTMVTYWHLRRKVSTAVILEDNIFQSEYVPSPFVLGIPKPRIYLPYNLGEEERKHVIAHERSHIRRRDHWWKPLGFGLLTLHWFNPLMWVAYILLCRDIELACDEKVIKELGNEERANYTQALLACSVNRRMIAACPLAFGEVGVKERVKSVMNYKKPTFWIILVAIVVCVATAVFFLTNPKDPKSNVGVTYHYGTVTAWDAAVTREGDREGGTYISLKCDDGNELLFWADEMNTTSEAMMGQHVMVRSRFDESSGLRIATSISITDNTWAYSAEEAIENAILDFNWSSRYDGMLQCADFVMLSNETGGSAATNEIDTEIFYGLALHQVFTVKNGELIEEGGSHIPTVLAFAIDESGRYILTEYWQPRDGSYYSNDIKEKFPAFVWPDTQEHIKRQIQNNYAKAAEYFQLDTDQVISSLLEQVEVSTALKTNRITVAEGDLAYRELLYYGKYTLSYCFSQFEKGNQTDYKAQIMSQVCMEVMEIWGESSRGKDLYAQEWYDAYSDHVESLIAKNSPDKLRTNKPSVVIYLQVKGRPLFDWGITFSAENAEPTGMVILCSQSGGNFSSKEGPLLSSINLTTGRYFWLQKLVDGAWTNLSVPEDLVWTTEAYVIPINDSVKWKVDWSNIYGSLEAGQYRIGKTISFTPAPGESELQAYYAEFIIG